MRSCRPVTGPPLVRPCARAYGFTLVELLVVLGLMSLLMAVALPRIDRTRMNVDEQERALRSVLLMAQRLAVTRGYDVVVAFDTAGRAIRVQEDPDGDALADPGERVTVTQLTGDVLFARGSVPVLRAGAGADMSFTGRQSGLPMVVFHRDGSTSEAGTFYLTTRRGLGAGYASDGRAFDLQPGTGRLLAYRYDGQSWRREN